MRLGWKSRGATANAVFDPSDDARPRTCGVDSERQNDGSRHLRGEHRPVLSLPARARLRGRPEYVGIVVFNDEKRYARHGADVEAHGRGARHLHRGQVCMMATS